MSIRASAFAWNLIGLTASQAFADDWTIVKIEGDALVYHDNNWNKLHIGDIVADESVVRTTANGGVQFMRDRETIDLEPNTQIQIFDRKGQRFTTVRQFFGVVGVEANVRNVRHFAVKTPFLAAVVKGTIFAVKTDAIASVVAVQRGTVRVVDAANSARADVHAGQAAISTAGHGVSVGAAAAGNSSAASAATAAAAAATTAAPAPSSATATAAAPSAASSAAASSAASAGTAGAAAASSAGSSAASSGAGAASSSGGAGNGGSGGFGGVHGFGFGDGGEGHGHDGHNGHNGHSGSNR